MHLIPVSRDSVIFPFLLYSGLWQPASYLCPLVSSTQDWCFRGVPQCPLPAQAACGPRGQLESGRGKTLVHPGAWRAPLQTHGLRLTVLKSVAPLGRGPGKICVAH